MTSNCIDCNGFIVSHATLTPFGKLCVGPNGVARSLYGSLIESGRKKVSTRRSKNVFAQHLHFGASFCPLPLISVRTRAPGHLSSRALLVANYKTLWRRIHVRNVQDKCVKVSMEIGSVDRIEVERSSERRFLSNRLPRMSHMICSVFGVRSLSVHACFVDESSMMISSVETSTLDPS
jgi:hypothetical protein